MAGSGKNRSSQESQSQSSTFVDPNQAGFLSDIRRQGQQLQQEQSPVIGDVASQLSGQLGGVGNDFLGSLQSTATSPFAGQSIAELLGLGGTDQAQQLQQLSGQLQGGSPELSALAQNGLDLEGLMQPGQQLQDQFGVLEGAVQRNLASTLNTLGGQASIAGQTGGGRELALAQRAGADSQRSFADAAAGLASNDLNTRRQLGGQLAAVNANTRLGAAQALQGGRIAGGGILADLLNTRAQGFQSAGQLGIGQAGAQIGGAQAGLGSLGSLFNLGLSPFGAQFQPLRNFASLIGSPTVLGRSSSTQEGRSRASSFSVANFAGAGQQGGG